MLISVLSINPVYTWLQIDTRIAVKIIPSFQNRYYNDASFDTSFTAKPSQFYDVTLALFVASFLAPFVASPWSQEIELASLVAPP